MKKALFSLFIMATILSTAQENNTPTLDKSGNIIGFTEKDHFLQEPFLGWFNFGYDDYAADADILKELKPLLKKVTIKVFMGTWCGDSQELVPVFYKILDEAGYKYKNFEMIAVNRSKKTPDNLQKGLDIIKVPTFIFYKKGKEIGRIVEYPRETIEKDKHDILSGLPYKHSYDND